MNSFDLRIGNRLIINGLVVSVLEIFNDSLKTSDHRTRCGYFIQYFEPIKLEKKIFNKIIKNDNILIHESNRFFTIYSNTNDYTFSIEEYPYLHQLQNLFYLLTKKELPINL